MTDKITYSAKGDVDATATITGIKSSTKINSDGSITGIYAHSYALEDDDMDSDDFYVTVKDVSLFDSNQISVVGSGFKFNFQGKYRWSKGNLVVEEYSDYAGKTIVGAANDDSISIYCVENAAIDAGAGDDYINVNQSLNTLIKYSSGDGKDRIIGFDSDDTLQIAGSYSTTKSSDGKDLIVNVGTGSITLKNTSTANIVQDNTNQITWTVKNTTATGKIDGVVVATITGVKKNAPASALSDNGSVITIAESALTANARNVVKLTKGNYTLAIADDIKSVTTPAGFYIDGTTATYKSVDITTGYSVATNGLSVSYVAKATVGKTLTTITGLKSGQLQVISV